MSAWTNENESSRRWAMFFSDPVSKLSTQMTRWPRSSRWSQRLEPRKPAPPVTSDVGMRVSVPGRPAPPLSRRSELDRLRLQELLQPEPTELATVAGLLVAAERRHRVEGRAVDLDLPGPDPPRHPPSAL